MADFTPTQGRYLAFLHAYTNQHGYPPAEAEIAAAMCVSPPSVNQMVKALERKGLILRQPGRARSIEVLVPDDEIPPWGRSKPAGRSAQGGHQARRTMAPPLAPPGNLYVLKVHLHSGPISDKFANRECSRVIEIRGDQTLEQLHEAIFAAYDRWDEHFYEFQFGKRPFDPAGPNYGIPEEPRLCFEIKPKPRKKPTGAGKAATVLIKKPAGPGDARETFLNDLGLKPERVFGYLFDFGDNWFHHIQVEKIEPAIRTVTYPRVTKRVGKSPPQYSYEE